MIIQPYHSTAELYMFYTVVSESVGWLGSRVASVRDSGALGPGFKSQPRRCLRQTFHTHRASVHQAAKLVAALLSVAGVTADLAESNGSLPSGHGRPRKGQGGSPDPLDFDINFSHIITVAPRVEIQMHFWKGAKFAGSVGHPMTKMLSASGGFAPLTL